MPPETTNAKLRWDDGDLPVSTRFNDPYYSRSDGLAESRHVFLQGNDLPERWRDSDGFHIAELGFGTGLNMLAAAKMWQTYKQRGKLRLTSFELYPLNTNDIGHALARWPELAPWTEALLAQWPNPQIELPGADLTVIFGDVGETLPHWNGTADAWFLDGFAPSRNPAMWTDPVLQAVAEHTSRMGTFATYTAAGFVRRSLSVAGFTVSKRAGFGSKREMLAGQLAHAPGTTPKGEHDAHH